MKRIMLVLGAVTMAAISVPTSASAQSGCSWWDLTCNGLASRVTDYGWHIAGRDEPGNVVYLRRRVDSNGNVIIEQSRRNDFGRYLVLNNYTIRRGNVYGANGERCKYSESDKGYKEECKYAKGTNVSGIRYPSGRYTSSGLDDCKYSSSEKGYKEQCKYAKVNDVSKAQKVYTSKYKPATYKAPKVHTVTYKAPKVNSVKYKGPKAAVVHEVKVKGGKDKGPKH